MEVELGGSARWDRGMRLKKAYISKTTEPNLKNEYFLVISMNWGVDLRFKT